MSSLALTIPASKADGTPVIVKYGIFLQTTLDFIIMVFCIFVMVKMINKLKKEAPKAPPHHQKKKFFLQKFVIY